ncbi:MAG: hypothetical protein FJ125_06810 [Deltaproteobacteria bacterium]|nr:hypothetical protein [Deltaproteobacteria bacterium]
MERQRLACSDDEHTRIVAATNLSFSQDDRAGWTRGPEMGDDACDNTDIPLGFTYTGFGASTSVVRVSSNGVLFFGSTCSSSLANSALPSSISSVPVLFFFWDDLHDYGGNEYYEYTTMGTAGGRVFMLWYQTRIHSACDTDLVRVMIQIFEGSNLVQAVYHPTSSCARIRGSSATFGFQTAGGLSAQAVIVGHNSPVVDDNGGKQFMSFHPPR